MSSSNKDDIINSIYYDRSGYGSVATTYKDAKEKDKNITLNDVKEWFKKNVEQKKQLRGFNSFVAPRAFYEFQIDLFFINDLPDQKFRIGMICVDIFSKYLNVAPLKSKQPPDILAGLLENIKKMGGKPSILYSDAEGSLNNQSVMDYLKEEKIELHRTRTHAAFAERGVRTFKKMLYDRVEADEKKGKENIQWTDYIFEILLTYNNKMVHSATKFTPKDARKPSNELKVKLNLGMNAKRNRLYPDVETGDKVKIFRKKGVGEKERTSTWSANTYTVERTEKKLNQNYYHIDGNPRAFLRHEILKV